MEESLGWSRTTLSWALTIKALCGMSIGPLLGPLLDKKHGPRLIMTLGGLILGISIILSGVVTEVWQFYLFFGLGYGVSSAMTSTDIVTPTIVSKWFIRLRGRALAISVMGISLGGLFFIPIASFMVLTFGWREAWYTLGIIALFLVVPTSFIFIRRAPEDIGLVPDGINFAEKLRSSYALGLFNSPAPVTSKGEISWSLKGALHTPTLWIMVLTFSIGTAGLGGFIVHAIPFMTDNGYSDVTASAYLVVFSVVAGVVKPVWGFLGEKIPVRYLLGFAFGISATGMLLLSWLDGGLFMGVVLIAYGIGAGAFVPLMNLMWANYYGRDSLGSIRGVFLPVTQVILAISPLFSGYVFDTVGTYAPAFLIFGLLFGFGMVAILVAKPPTERFTRTV
jgi:MFS family permease